MRGRSFSPMPTPVSRTSHHTLDASPPHRLVAVFDWEMSAIGDPLVDLGILLCYWLYTEGVTQREGWFGRRKRFSEWWIVSGQKLFVAGTVRRLRNAVLERRMALGDRLKALKHDAGRMQTFDANRDGQIDAEEWGNAVRSVQDDLVREDAQEPQEPEEESILNGKGTDETTFVIAERGEKALLLRLGLTAAGGLLGGGAAVILSIASLLARAGVMRGGWIIPW